MTAEERELQSRSLRREVNERIAELIDGAHIDTTADSIIARRNGYALIEHAPDRLSLKAPPPRKEPTSPVTTNLSGR
jgi:hypothetical protein